MAKWTKITKNDIIFMKLHRKVGDSINIKKMINMLLQKLSFEYDIFYMEKRNYRDGKIFKTFIIKIGNIKEEFRNERDLLLFLKDF